MRTKQPVLPETVKPFSGRDPIKEFFKSMDRLNFESAKFWAMQIRNIPVDIQFNELSTCAASGSDLHGGDSRRVNYPTDKSGGLKTERS